MSKTVFTSFIKNQFPGTDTQNVVVGESWELEQTTEFTTVEDIETSVLYLQRAGRLGIVRVKVPTLRTFSCRGNAKDSHFVLRLGDTPTNVPLEHRLRAEQWQSCYSFKLRWYETMGCLLSIATMAKDFKFQIDLDHAIEGRISDISIPVSIRHCCVGVKYAQE